MPLRGCKGLRIVLCSVGRTQVNNQEGKLGQPEWQRLRFARQFIVAEMSLDLGDHWQMIPLDGGLVLHAHPFLNVTRLSWPSVEVVLIGYVIDPYSPTSSDEDIVTEIASVDGDIVSVLQACEKYSGRYAILLRLGNRRYLFGDAGNTRRIYYHRDASGNMWIASSPNIIAAHVHLSADPDAEEFMVSECFVSNADERWWPGDGTQYEDVYNLLPNHYLDLQSLEPIRYWPLCDIAEMDLEHAVSEGVEVLKNSVEAAASRFSLGLAISAGVDSRMILAATRGIKEKVFYYTSRYGHMNDHHRDLVVPGQMLSDLGLEHHVFPVPQAVDPQFRSTLSESVPFERDRRIRATWGNYLNFPEGLVLMTGHMSGPIRAHYRHHSQKGAGAVDAAGLAGLVAMSGSSYAVAAFQRWLQGLGRVLHLGSLNVLDLFQWEQAGANWGGQGYAEGDVSHDLFLPLSNRKFIVTMLGVDERLRRKNSMRVFYGLIEEMWPELLRYPVNPKTGDGSHFVAVRS